MMQMFDSLRTIKLCLSLSWLGLESALGKRELISRYTMFQRLTTSLTGLLGWK